MNSIYIKPSRRKCSVSDYKCFDIYDNNKNKIDMPDCDVIDIFASKAIISMEVVDGMTHIWSHSPLKFRPLINTFIIEFEEKEDDR